MTRESSEGVEGGEQNRGRFVSLDTSDACRSSARLSLPRDVNLQIVIRVWFRHIVLKENSQYLLGTLIYGSLGGVCLNMQFSILRGSLRVITT